MTTMDTTCAQCGQLFTPTPEHIRVGLWRVCARLAGTVRNRKVS